MANGIRYVHTNIVAKDWKKLAQFYIDVLECQAMYPERDLSGEWIEKLTGIPKAHIRGIHLKLPGCETTLELFEYRPENLRSQEPGINSQGFGHIAFHVDDVEGVLAAVLKHGGKQLGKVIRNEHPEQGILTVVYASDPEGNFIELQNWKR